MSYVFHNDMLIIVETALLTIRDCTINPANRTLFVVALFSPMKRQLGVEVMSVIERLLSPDSTELPDCRCGTEMALMPSEASRVAVDVQIRVYKCPACGHELRLTVWATEA